MQKIRPVSDLRNKFTEVSCDVHKSGEPVFLTKNGVGDMVVMSMEAFAALEFDSSVYTKLQDAEREAETTSKRYSPDEVLAAIRSTLESSALVPHSTDDADMTQRTTEAQRASSHV